jgi:hypothetical protein
MVGKSGGTTRVRREDGKAPKGLVRALGSLPVPLPHKPFVGNEVTFVNGTITCLNEDLKKALHEYFLYEASGCHSATVVHSLGSAPVAKSSKRKKASAKLLKKDGKAASGDPSTMDGGQVVVDVRC